MNENNEGLLHGMCLGVRRALEVLEDVQVCHSRLRCARVSRILYPDMIQLAHITKH